MPDYTESIVLVLQKILEELTKIHQTVRQIRDESRRTE